MNEPLPENADRRRHRREKATPDQLVDRDLEPESPERDRLPSTTDSGAPVEEQVRKEWDPRKGGLPTF